MEIIRIFVSSTFKDFHHERDALRRQVLPELNREAAPWGCRVELTDLRWGVDTSSAADRIQAERLIAQSCRREIEEAHPLFLALIGERYGTVMAQSVVQWNLGSTAPAEALSVTALECRLALNDPNCRPIFSIRTMAGDRPDRWVDADVRADAMRHEIRSLVRDHPRADGFEYSLRFHGAQVDNESLASFVDQVAGALREQVISEASRRAQSRELTAKLGSYAETAAAFATSRLDAVDRTALVGRITGVLASDLPGCVLVGRSGTGKSTLAMQIASQAAEQGRQVARTHVGLDAQVSTVEGVVRQATEQLGGRLDDVTEEDWRTQLSTLEDGALLVFDALDQLSDPDARSSLPFLPGNVETRAKLLCTTTSEDQARLLEQRGLEIVEVGDLTVAEVRGAIAEQARRQHRQVPASVVELLAAGPRSALWTTLALTRLQSLGRKDFEEAEQLEAAGVAPAHAVLELLHRRVESLPDDLHDLALSVLLSAAADTPDPKSFLALLGLARSGLAIDELASLSGSTPLAASRTRWMLDDVLVRLDDHGRVAFGHRLMTECAIAGHDQRELEGLHRQLGSWALRRIETDPTEGTVLDAIWHGLSSRSGAVLGPALTLAQSHVERGVVARLVAAFLAREEADPDSDQAVWQALAARGDRDELSCAVAICESVVHANGRWGVHDRSRLPLMAFMASALEALGDAPNPEFLVRWASANQSVGAVAETASLYRLALARAHENGIDTWRDAAAAAELGLASVDYHAGKHRDAWAHVRAAEALVAGTEAPLGLQRGVLNLTRAIGVRLDVPDTARDIAEVIREIDRSVLGTETLPTVEAMASQLETRLDEAPLDLDAKSAFIVAMISSIGSAELAVDVNTLRRCRELITQIETADPQRARAFELRARLENAAAALAMQQEDWDAVGSASRAALDELDGIPAKDASPEVAWMRAMALWGWGEATSAQGDSATACEHIDGALTILRRERWSTQAEAATGAQIFQMLMSSVGVNIEAGRWTAAFNALAEAQDFLHPEPSESTRYHHYLQRLKRVPEVNADAALLRGLGDAFLWWGRAIADDVQLGELGRVTVAEGHALQASYHTLVGDDTTALQCQFRAVEGYRRAALEKRATFQQGYIASLEVQRRLHLRLDQKSTARQLAHLIYDESERWAAERATDPVAIDTVALALINLAELEPLGRRGRPSAQRRELLMEAQRWLRGLDAVATLSSTGARMVTWLEGELRRRR